MPAAIEIIEFRFGDGIVHVNGRNQQPIFLRHLVKAMHAGCGFFRNAAPVLCDFVPAIRIFTMNFQQQIFDDLLFLVRRFRLGPIAAFLELITFVDEQRRIAAIIDHQLRTLASGVRNRSVSAPPVVFQRFFFPCEDGDAAFGDRRGRMILRGENVAACPAHVRAEIGQRLNQHGRLDRHVQRPSDSHPSKRFLRRILFPDRHQPGHFLFRDGNFSSAKVGERNIGDFVILFGFWLSDCCAHKVFAVSMRRPALTLPPCSFFPTSARRGRPRVRNGRNWLSSDRSGEGDSAA